MIQCRRCNEWGHFARDCQSGVGQGGLLCKWCGPGNHEDTECPRQKGVNMLEVVRPELNSRCPEVLAITRSHTRKLIYPDPGTEKGRLKEAQREVEREMSEEWRKPAPDKTTNTMRTDSETTIMKQLRQTTVPVRVVDLLQTLPQLRIAINQVEETKKEGKTLNHKEEMEGRNHAKETNDPMLMTVGVGRTPAVVEMEILGFRLTNTIVDGGSAVNVLPEETWKTLGRPTLWPPAFHLVGADQHGIKPLGTRMGQKVTIRTQHFFLDFMVISLERKGYDALLGRGWLVTAKVDHNWKKNTLSIESEGNKYVIDLRNQQVSQEMASDSDSEGNTVREKGEIEPNGEGVLRLGNCSEDETSSLSGLFHWQMDDYEILQPECNVLEILELGNDGTYPPQFAEYEEGGVEVDSTPAHQFEKEVVQYEEPKVQSTNLGDEKDPRVIMVGDDWNPVLKAAAFKIFLEYKDVFAWTYKDLKGVPPELCVHRIPLMEGARPVRKRPYRMNKNYAAKVQEEIEKMLDAGIIFRVQTSEWVSPIVISLKKEGNKICICVDFRSLNAVTIKDPFPIPFTDSILEEVAGHEIYSFMDGFSGYNQISIAEEDKLKTTFIVEDGAFAYNRMPFGLCNAPATF